MYRYSAIITSIILVASTQTAFGYPIAMDQVVQAKWDHLYLSICVKNESDPVYEKLFLNAVEQWKEAWPHFSFNVNKNTSGCDIDASITEYSVGLPKERHSQGTTEIKYWPNGNIVKADITIPTKVKKEVRLGDDCCMELTYTISEKKFYLVSLHEFGHALGLGHSKETEKEPFDVMHVIEEHNQYIISQVAVKTLDRMYGKSTNAVDYSIDINPSLVMQVSIDKERYVLDENVNVSGKVSKVYERNNGKIILLKLQEPMSIYATSYFVPQDDGMFAMDIELRTNYNGKWMVVVQYMHLTEIRLFDVDPIPYTISAETDKERYKVGDTVRIDGSVSRYVDAVVVDIINPNGIKFIHKTVHISEDRQFVMDFTLRESHYTVNGEWTILLSYADTTNAITLNVER
jgi:predicted Zn-dependent protease